MRTKKTATYHRIFDRIAAVNATAKLCVVATDRINPWPKYWFRRSMDESNDRRMVWYLEEMRSTGRVIYPGRSTRIWAPEPPYGPSMAVAVRGKYKFQALTQRETLMAHRTGKFPYACINVVSGDEDSLFLAAVYDNTKNGHRYRYVELTELIKDIKCEFPHVNEWEIARLVGAEPDLVKKVLTEIQNW